MNQVSWITQTGETDIIANFFYKREAGIQMSSQSSEEKSEVMQRKGP